MKTIIAGSRTILDYQELERAMLTVPWEVTHVVSGGANGVDTLGERYAREHNLPLTVMKAEWRKEGNGAGYNRNVRMAENAEALVALWNGVSRGTYHMITIAHQKRLKVHVVKI